MEQDDINPPSHRTTLPLNFSHSIRHTRYNSRGTTVAALQALAVVTATVPVRDALAWSLSPIMAKGEMDLQLSRQYIFLYWAGARNLHR